MALQPIISRFFDLRALLVIAALISLCVSNNVGPSFLPLPVVTDFVAENPQENQRDTATLPPSPAESDSFRVPMVAQTQKRADKEPQPQLLAATLKGGFVFPNEARVATEFSYPIPLFTSASVPQPSGRAPPHLV
jgi:hypothetical protein